VSSCTRNIYSNFIASGVVLWGGAALGIDAHLEMDSLRTSLGSNCRSAAAMGPAITVRIPPEDVKHFTHALSSRLYLTLGSAYRPVRDHAYQPLKMEFRKWYGLSPTTSYWESAGGEKRAARLAAILVGEGPTSIGVQSMFSSSLTTGRATDPMIAWM
jgi:hypothetical protein